jgi:hypothetical protein
MAGWMGGENRQLSSNRKNPSALPCLEALARSPALFGMAEITQGIPKGGVLFNAVMRSAAACFCHAAVVLFLWWSATTKRSVRARAPAVLGALRSPPTHSVETEN